MICVRETDLAIAALGASILLNLMQLCSAMLGRASRRRRLAAVRKRRRQDEMKRELDSQLDKLASESVYDRPGPISAGPSVPFDLPTSQSQQADSRFWHDKAAATSTPPQQWVQQAEGKPCPVDSWKPNGKA